MPFSQVGTPGPGGAASSNAGYLYFHPEQLDGAIALFQSALDQLEAEVLNAMAGIQAQPLARDPVSEDVVEAFNRIGCDNPDSAIAAWRGAVGQLNSVVAQLRAAKLANEQADFNNAEQLRAL